MKAYQKNPTAEHLCLVVLSYWGALMEWEAIYLDAALPSEVILRLEAGLKKKKRYLGLWVTSWLKARKKILTLQQEAEGIVAWLNKDEHGYQSPSDPGFWAAIEKALRKLTKKDREIIVWLSQERTPKEIATLRGISHDNAKQQVVRARDTFKAALPKEYQKK